MSNRFNLPDAQRMDWIHKRTRESLERLLLSPDDRLIQEIKARFRDDFLELTDDEVKACLQDIAMHLP